MERAYWIIFGVGVIYTLVTALIGGLFGAFHFGENIDANVDTNFDTHVDTHLDAHVEGSGVSSIFAVFPLKPITIVSFLTVFGGIGVLGTYNRLGAVITFTLAFTAGLMVSTLLYKFVVVPLYKAQNTSAVSQDKLIGIQAKVISPIFEDGFGTITYTVNGNIYNAPAQHIGKKAVPQGEDVVIYEIKSNVFYVEVLNDTD